MPKPLSARYRTVHLDALDQHGRLHLVYKRTEVLDVKFSNGSTGAIFGLTKYVLNGRDLCELGGGLFTTLDGTLKLTFS